MNRDSDSSENKLTASLQACNPSNHVCSVLELLIVPHLLNQAPPGAQQLSLPDFLVVPHLEHMEPIDVSVVAGAADNKMYVLGQRK